MSSCIRKPTISYAKTKAQTSFAVTVKLISVFVFATLIVQSLFFLHRKFEASSYLLCVDLDGNPNCWFSHAQAQIYSTNRIFPPV